MLGEEQKLFTYQVHSKKHTDKNNNGIERVPGHIIANHFKISIRINPSIPSIKQAIEHTQEKQKNKKKKRTLLDSKASIEVTNICSQGSKQALYKNPLII